MSVAVSVIVPVYNGEKFLEKSLMSLANQTLKNIEIICVNNASTDSSLNILLAFKEVFPDKFVILNSETNGGPGGGRNIGIYHARGEYIGFMDQDDFADKNMYRSMYETGVSGSFDIVSAGYYYNKTPFLPKSITGTININDKIELCNDILYVWNKIYKKEVISEMSELFRKNTYDDDVDFCVEAILRCNKVSFIPQLFYHYNRNSNSETLKIYHDKINLNQLMSDYKHLFSALNRRITSVGFDTYIFEIGNAIYPLRILTLLASLFSLDNFSYNAFCEFDDVARSFSPYYYEKRYQGNGLAHMLWNELSENKPESYERLVNLKKRMLSGELDK